MKYFKSIKDLESAKKQYKKLAMKYHPDRGGDEEIMKAINNEYEILVEKLSADDKQSQSAMIYKDILDKIINLDVKIEIIGTWIWVSGDTYKYRKELKETGFYWASKKKKWYYREDNEKCSYSHGSVPFWKIKAKYGSSIIKEGESNKKSQEKNRPSLA